MLKELDSYSCEYLLSRLIELGDEYFSNGKRLEERGFIAFHAHMDEVEGLAKNEEELDLHRKIEVEKAKEHFANPFVGGAILPELRQFKTPYKSQLLKELSQRNDLDGMMEQRIKDEKLLDQQWMLEIDPCLRTLGKMTFPEREGRRRFRQNKFKELRQIELDRFLQKPHPRSRPQEEGVASEIAFKTFGHCMARYGFERNNTISTAKSILFSKPLVDDWILNITILSNHWGFDSYSFEMVDGKKIIGPKLFEIHLDLRKNKQKGMTLKKLSYLPLKFSLFSPLGEYSYSAYMDVDEMAIGILGYSELYGLMGNEIEAKLSDGIKEL